jgi:hypothetical protein
VDDIADHLVEEHRALLARPRAERLHIEVNVMFMLYR